jgi:hypothetical protein
MQIIKERPQDVFLTREVVVQRGSGDPGARSDIRHARALETEPQEGPPRTIQNAASTIYGLNIFVAHGPDHTGQISDLNRPTGFKEIERQRKFLW